MTTEKAIEILSDVGDINRCCAEDAVALGMAIKALEQEDVLDNIRAEVEQITDTMGVSYNQYVSKIDVLQIIDKYKAESEEEE